MFDAVTIAQKSSDAGSVAEALVYYGKTDLVLGNGTLTAFVERFGFQTLMRAIDMGLLKVTYEVASHVVVTTKMPSEIHGFAIAGQANQKKNRQMTAAEQIEQQFGRRFGKSSEVRAQARLLSQRVVERRQVATVLTAIQSQILDKSYLESCIRELLCTIVPEYQIPTDLGLDVFDTGQGFVILTELDFPAINKIYHRNTPIEHSSVNMADLLAKMLDAEKEFDFASKSDADLWVDEAGSSILRLRANVLANRAMGSRKYIDYFHSVEFEGRTFRSVINSGERTVSELLDLLEKKDAREFRSWLSKQNPTGALLREYDRAVFSSASWTRQLPFKVGKLLVFAGMGVALGEAVGEIGLGAAAAVAASFGTNIMVGTSDEVLMSRLNSGWKPNQFVEGSASRFIRGQ